MLARNGKDTPWTQDIKLNAYKTFRKSSYISKKSGDA